MSNVNKCELKIGDRVEWESQSQGSWKRKEGVVVEVNDTTFSVDVDTIVSVNPISGEEHGKVKKLKKTKRYHPRKKFCRKSGEALL